MPIESLVNFDLGSGSKVIDSPDPTNSQDVATKNYVDSHFAGAAGGLVWAGTWNSSTTYAPSDVVEYSGSSYVTENTTTVAPPSAPWELVAQQGATGPTGPQGPQGVVGPIGPMGPRGAGGSQNVANYVLYTTGGTTFASNGTTGVNDYSGTDAGAVLTSVITALGVNGGIVLFASGTYNWQSVPALPPNLNNWLVIRGEKNAYISLTNAAPRFLDAGKRAAGDTFQYLHVEGFTIDATAVTPAGHNHVVFGTYAANSTASGWDVSFDHVTIRRIRTLGLGASTDTVNTAQFNVFIVTYVSAAGLPQRYLTNILVEQCDFYGGTYGVAVYGTKSSLGGWTGEANIWIDNVTIRDIKHDCGSDPPGFNSYAHIQVGSRANGGTVWISNIWGRGSHDVGIEVDGMLDAHIQNVFMRNVHGYVLALTNFQAPPNWQSQQYTIRDITFVRDGGVWSTSSAGMIGFLASNNSAVVQQPFGRVDIRDIKMFADGANLPDIMSHQIQGEILNLTHSPLELLIDGVSYYCTPYNQTNTGTAASPNIFYSRYNAGGGGQVTKLTIRNVDANFQGVNAAGAQPMNATGFYISGGHNFLFENVSCALNITNPGTFVQYGMKLGHDSGSNMRGSIRGFRMLANTDTNGRGIAYYDTTTVAIPDQIFIQDCDFKGMAGGQEVFAAGAGDNISKVFSYNNKWINYPLVPQAITAAATGVSKQWLGGYTGLLSVTGATVSKIEVSPDNVNWYTVANTTTAIFTIQHTYWWRVTYTGGVVATLLASI